MTERLEAAAKINLGLDVLGIDRDGYHRIRSLVHTIGWRDRLELMPADEDRLVVDGPDIEGDNLVWKAVRLVRQAMGVRRPLDIRLEKHIPIAAGLGGGSADAAAALVASARIVGAPEPLIRRLAGDVGADVPYLLTGGFALMEGRGERVTSLPAVTGFAIAVVVPPFTLATATVYDRWDQMDGPTGRTIAGGALPPALRPYGPVRNDLEPAAVDLEPELAGWIHELETRWDRPVMMSGSGPSLFAYCLDTDEAAAVVAEAPAAVRARSGVPLADRALIETSRRGG